MKRNAVVLAIVACLILVSSVAFAGRNYGGYANLTWVPGNHVRYADQPLAVKNLYLRLEQIHEICGCEFGMSWGKDVGTPDIGCFELIDVQAPIGTDCNFLMRGTVIFGLKDVQMNRVDAAFAGSGWVSVCTGGQTARLPFDFSMCDPGDTGWFCLEYCKVTDHFGMIDWMTIVLGNPGWSCAYIVGPTPTEPATWGSIKALYR
jgi:hypothetical protein